MPGVAQLCLHATHYLPNADSKRKLHAQFQSAKMSLCLETPALSHGWGARQNKPTGAPNTVYIPRLTFLRLAREASSAAFRPPPFSVSLPGLGGSLPALLSRRWPVLTVSSPAMLGAVLLLLVVVLR